MKSDSKSEFIPWFGDKCPAIDGLRCDILLRNGTILENENSYDWWNDWCWKDKPHSDTDIVGYRLLNDK